MQSRFLHADDTRSIIDFVRMICFKYGGQLEFDDMVQEVLFKLFRRSLPKLIRTSWLARFIQSRVYDLHRRNKRRVQLITQRLDPESLEFEDIIANIPAPGYDSADPDLLPAIESALSKLSPSHRQVVELTSSGLSYQEVAALTGVPVGTIRSRLSHARKTLSLHLSEFR